ncbi:succinate dehydrogenase subunit C, partial [mine drainage metagenome]
PVYYRGPGDVLRLPDPVREARDGEPDRGTADPRRPEPWRRGDGHALPVCHISLDGFQKQAARTVGERLEMPVFHLPQLVGLALGATPEELGLDRH